MANKVNLSPADALAIAREPLNMSYEDPWLPARYGIKARLCRHAVACQEVATPSPHRAESPVGRTVKHASAALQPLPRTKAISFALRLASTCFRVRRDPIGLVQRFLNQGGSIKIAYRDVAVRRPGGRATQEQFAGSSQIFPDFVQVQTVFWIFHDFRA